MSFFFQLLQVLLQVFLYLFLFPQLESNNSSSLVHYCSPLYLTKPSQAIETISNLRLIKVRCHCNLIVKVELNKIACLNKIKETLSQPLPHPSQKKTKNKETKRLVQVRHFFAVEQGSNQSLHQVQYGIFLAQTIEYNFFETKLFYSIKNIII